LQGYYGCAVGKAKQAAKTEIEKLKVTIVATNFSSTRKKINKFATPNNDIK